MNMIAQQPWRRHAHRWLPAVLAVGFFCGGACAEAQTPAEKVTNVVNSVRQALETSLGKTVPSLSLLIETSNETFFASSAAAPWQALTPGTYFRFASNTKNFTAAAVLRLHHQGLLNIHDRISDLIPGSGIPYVPATSNWNIPHKDVITIRQLLQHSAGVYDVDNNAVPGCGGAPYVEYQLGLDPGHQFTAAELVGQDALHTLLFFAPDQDYHYSDTGYTILGEIIARVYSQFCGLPKTCSDYLHEQIVGATSPVPLAAIRFPHLATDTALPEPFVSGVRYLPGGETLITSNANVSANVAEGNGYATMAALNRYIRTLMKGENVLNAQQVRLMQTNTAPYNANYGFGCSFMQDIGYGHTGAELGYLSLMGYNPDTDVSVAVCLPFWDESGQQTLPKCFNAMTEVAACAAEALGCPRTPVLAAGATTNINLAAGAAQRFALTARTGIYYRVTAGNAAAVFLGLAPAANPGAQNWSVNKLDWVCPANGTYAVTVTSAVPTPCSLRLDTLGRQAGPLVTANGLTGEGVCLGTADHLTIAVQMMNVEPYIGTPVDWWVVALAGSSWFYLNNSFQWTPFDGNTSKCHPAYQGALCNLPASLLPALNISGLPVSSYTFWFAVDSQMNGILNAEEMWADSVNVTVLPAPALPTPCVKANGTAGEITVNYTNAMEITVEMNARDYLGVPVDWWVVALAGSSWYYLNNSFQWTPFDGNTSKCHPAYQGALCNLPASPVLSGVFPPGTYNFYFAADYPMDGILSTTEQIWISSVKVTAQ